MPYLCLARNTLYSGAIQALLRRYYGAIKALLRRYYGAIKALLRRYQDLSAGSAGGVYVLGAEDV